MDDPFKSQKSMFCKNKYSFWQNLVWLNVTIKSTNIFFLSFPRSYFLFFIFVAWQEIRFPFFSIFSVAWKQSVWCNTTAHLTNLNWEGGREGGWRGHGIFTCPQAMLWFLTLIVWAQHRSKSVDINYVYFGTMLNMNWDVKARKDHIL